MPIDQFEFGEFLQLVTLSQCRLALVIQAMYSTNSGILIFLLFSKKKTMKNKSER